ncbi:hypothetical protein AB0G79_33085 [Streptomyces sp. NPDC020807]|uniref:hypothetical protein n=1 Tax=Streptomyces sp. NPDC020807 TaxID=3155119 RepID=UPI0033FEDE7B
MPTDLTPTPDFPGIHLGGRNGASYACACGRVRREGPGLDVEALSAEWETHRAECRPKRIGPAAAPTRSGGTTKNRKRTTTDVAHDGGLF